MDDSTICFITFVNDEEWYSECPTVFEVVGDSKGDVG